MFGSGVVLGLWSWFALNVETLVLVSYPSLVEVITSEVSTIPAQPRFLIPSFCRLSRLLVLQIIKNHVLFDSKNRKAETAVRGSIEACFRVSTSFGSINLGFHFCEHCSWIVVNLHFLRLEESISGLHKSALYLWLLWLRSIIRFSV